MTRFRIYKHPRSVKGLRWRVSHVPHEMEFLCRTHEEAVSWMNRVIAANRHPALAA